MSLLAAFIITASPAAAASNCVVATDDGNVVVLLDDDEPGLTNTLAMVNGTVLFNGRVCGTPVSAITIIEISPTPQPHSLVFDLREGAFRVGVNAIFVNTFLADDDSIEVIGSDSADIVTMSSTRVRVSRENNFTGSDNGILLETGFSGEPSFEFNLRRGPDRFTMTEPNGNSPCVQSCFSGSLTVNGGSGADELSGAPGTQTFTGGKGADVLSGFRGPDVLDGNGGDDVINGGSGHDIISAGNGRDRVNAGKGRDTIDAAGGKADDIRGGGGRDTCTCGPEDSLRSIERVR